MSTCLRSYPGLRGYLLAADPARWKPFGMRTGGPPVGGLHRSRDRFHDECHCCRFGWLTQFPELFVLPVLRSPLGPPGDKREPLPRWRRPLFSRNRPGLVGYHFASAVH
jgi:hypothetical protein